MFFVVATMMKIQNPEVRYTTTLALALLLVVFKSFSVFTAPPSFGWPTTLMTLLTKIKRTIRLLANLVKTRKRLMLAAATTNLCTHVVLSTLGGHKPTPPVTFPLPLLPSIPLSPSLTP